MIEYTKEDLIKKAKEKSLYKYRGKVHAIVRVSDNIVNCVCFKMGKSFGKNEKIFTSFTCFGDNGSFFINNYVKNDRLKIKFKIFAREYKNNWYNSLTVFEHEKWRLNDDKLNKAERIEKIEKSFAEKERNKQTGMKFNEGDWE